MKRNALVKKFAQQKFTATDPFSSSTTSVASTQKASTRCFCSRANSSTAVWLSKTFVGLLNASCFVAIQPQTDADTQLNKFGQEIHIFCPNRVSH